MAQRHFFVRGAKPRSRRFWHGGWLVAALLVAPAVLAIPPNTQPPLKSMHVDLHDKAALRTGALYVMHQCTACHSLQGTRYAELAAPLGLTRKQVESSFMPADLHVFDTIASAMPEAFAKKFFGTAPPDLTVISRRRSVDWLYTYLTSFYVDPSRFTGANNVVVHNVAMPDVFAHLQGLQKPIPKMGYRNGTRTKVAIGVVPLTRGSMTPAQFDHMARDIVDFLYYLGHPHQQQSRAIGLWVLIVFAVLSVLMYLVYRLYWRRVKHAPGGRWWQYWKR